MMHGQQNIKWPFSGWKSFFFENSVPLSLL